MRSDPTPNLGIVICGILKLVQALVGLRVSREEVIEGLDIVSHKERGYDL